MAPNEQESSGSLNAGFFISSQNIESSSSLSSSEFVPLVAPCKTETGDNCEYGKLVDNRDGQTYKTVKIGTQTWMAENLNYKVDSSFCYNNEESYCSKYGRLYSWAAAVGKSEAECGYGYICSLPSGKIRGVCPEGWHLPDSTEWNVLFDAVGVKKIGTKVLKSMSGWDNNGSDAYGFSALPAGLRQSTRGNFYGETATFFWSASEVDGYCVDIKGIPNDHSCIIAKDWDASVRCVQDDASVQNSIISSSSIKSSSSEVQYGTLTDSRDGQTYRTVTIGKQIWMAENLNFKMDSSFCYDNKEINCAKGGRFYKWDYARYVCPAGWHLPTKDEWNVLIATVGGLSIAAKRLKFTSGWSWPTPSIGTSGSKDTDMYGFSAVPAGYWGGVALRIS
ncbi:FISUMP domain-containing protein [Fibrobacter sp. UWT3]|uniref:FISUMP domain-containing protein n=1 Tax=Fibrobacter sp. UWT3 TaxID=1896225 RepID=UPI0015968AE0|nr:FISUMP domain-containing protein [Fibrobacter sp. UWT3]